MTKSSESKDTQPDPMIGVLLDDYKITKLLGKGGMARVYEARDTKLARRVAIKIMGVQHDDFDSEMAQRFFREARAVANLDHPNIVTVYRFGEGEGIYYIAMKLIEGQTLQVIMKNNRKRKKYMEPERILRILGEIGSALDYAHKQGVVHRDIKPSNIMITPDDHAVLMDFGLLLQSGSESTMGTAFGTPRYISPEQAVASNRAGPPSDIYSLGVVLYEMATGQTPFEGDSPMNLALNHINNPPPPPKTFRPELSDAVQNAILKALEKQPQDRWPSAKAMVEALRAAYQGSGPEVLVSRELLENPAERLTTINAPVPSRTSDPTAVLPPTKEIPTPELRRRRAWLPFAVLLVLFIASLILGAISLNQRVQALSVGVSETPRPSPVLRMVYTDSQLVLINLGSKPLSLAGLALIGDQNAKVDLGEFTAMNAGRCVVWRLRGADPDPSGASLPALCNGAATPRTATSAFWTAGDFALRRGTTILVKCLAQLNTCEVESIDGGS